MKQPQNDYVVVLITAGSNEEATRIGQRLLEERLAACVNTTGGVESKFWWQGKLDEAREAALIVKTKAGLLPDIIKSVKKVHSYEVPEIIALPIVGGSREYLDWIDSMVR
jgi:periplasmic divalent cation tolerance protein